MSGAIARTTGAKQSQRKRESKGRMKNELNQVSRRSSPRKSSGREERAQHGERAGRTACRRWCLVGCAVRMGLRVARRQLHGPGGSPEGRERRGDRRWRQPPAAPQAGGNGGAARPTGGTGGGATGGTGATGAPAATAAVGVATGSVLERNNHPSRDGHYPAAALDARPPRRGWRSIRTSPPRTRARSSGAALLRTVAHGAARVFIAVTSGNDVYAFDEAPAPRSGPRTSGRRRRNPASPAATGATRWASSPRP